MYEQSTPWYWEARIHSQPSDIKRRSPHSSMGMAQSLYSKFTAYIKRSKGMGCGGVNGGGKGVG